MKTILFAVPALVLAVSAEAATVAPHRAVYELSLLRASEGSGLQSADGRIGFEVEGSTCDGFTVNFRMAVKYRPKEGEVTLIDTVTTTYEGPGALDFRHQLTERVDGEMRTDHRIKMSRPAATAEGKGSVSTEQGPVFTVPAGAALPMQHQLRLMALGEQGGGRDSSVIYDGSNKEKAYRAISFVGKEKPPGSIGRDAENAAAKPLGKVGAWPVSITYFSLEGNAETPEYQVSFDLYENGVASGLVLDYGDFALSGTLSDLKMFEAASCQ